MNMDDPIEDEAENEGLMNLVGDLHMAFSRARKSGADVADVIACVGQATGEFLADEKVSMPVTLVMTEVALTAQRAHAHRGRAQ